MGRVITPNTKPMVRSGKKLPTTNFCQNLITPIQDTNSALSLQSIYADHGFLHMWSAENILVSGSTTTFYDYAGTHDLANATSGEQPTVNSSDANFGGKQSIGFDGTQGVEKSVANWRSSDNAGMITYVCNPTSSKTNFGLVSSDESANGTYIGDVDLSIFDLGRINSGVLLRDGNNTSDFPATVITMTGNGTQNTVFQDGVKLTLTSTGAGEWMNDSLNRDNICIGKLIRSSGTSNGTMEWVLSGYHNSVLSDADIQAMHQDIMDYYSIS